MINSTVMEGVWWVKGKEDDKFVGILSYAEGYKPVLEIFAKKREHGTQKFPIGSVIYGDVIKQKDSSSKHTKVLAVTLLGCSSQISPGFQEVGAYIYNHEHVYVDCVVIGMLLNEDEIQQVMHPQRIFLECPNLDEYSDQNTAEIIWKDEAPTGENKVYLVMDTKEVIVRQPDPIVIQLDVGVITIILAQIPSQRGVKSTYTIQIELDDPMPEEECNTLIYNQLLSFISVLSGTKATYSNHSISIISNQTRSKRLSLVLHYGHRFSDMPNVIDKSKLLIWGHEDNLEKMPLLFSNWRKNYQSIEPLISPYMRILEDTRWIYNDHLLDSIKMIEEYAIRKNIVSVDTDKTDIERRFIAVMSYIQQGGLSYFQDAHISKIANQIRIFRNKGSHARNRETLLYSTQEIYGTLVLIVRSLFLIEMGFPNINVAYDNWLDLRQLIPKVITE